MKYKELFGKLKAEGEEGDYIIVSGFANYNAPDDVQERLDPKSMDDSRFKKNPVMLYNHQKDYPVGDVIEYEKRDDGIFIKRARISKSDVPQIKFVRDLVLEGILKGFSVGFMGGDSEKDPQNDKGYLTKNWKWFELSIVPLPMQADSLLSVSKAYNDKMVTCKTLSEARIMTLTLKGAEIAALIAGSTADMDDATKQDAYTRICEIAGCTPEELSSVVTGDLQQPSEEQIMAISEVLGIPLENLQSAAETDSKIMDEQPAPEPEAEPEEKEAVGGMSECVSEKIPKLIAEGKPQEQAIAIAISMCSDEKGCSPSELTDKEWESFAALASECASKAVDAPEHPEQTETKSMDTQDNLMIQLLQGIQNSLGGIATQIESLNQLMTAYLGTKHEEEPEAEDVEEQEMKGLIAEAKGISDRLKSLLG